MITYTDFPEANQDWDLDRLFSDIEQANGTRLTDRDRKLLRGLLCYFQPKDIAQKGWGNLNSACIRSDLTKLYHLSKIC
jgi:hypothetical protein